MDYKEIYGKNWIKPGLEVCDIDNREQKMVVVEMVRRSKKGVEGRDMSIVIGVKCGWWVESRGSKFRRSDIFHTRRLLPWDVVLDGEKAVKKFQSEVIFG